MPRYVQFPRSNVPGATPEAIDPGSFAINWADRKIFTGGPNGETILQAYRLSDFDVNRAYREQDIMYHEKSLWRCTVDFAQGPFNPSQWLELTDVSTAPYKELSATVWISGGELALNGSGVSVGGGSGVVMATTAGQVPNISPISWPSFELAAPLEANASLLVGVDGNGAYQVVNQATLEESQAWRRAHVLLGWITTDSVGNAVTADNVGVTQHQTRGTLSDFLNIIGPFKTEGCEINLSNTSELRVASGELFWQGLEPLSLNPNVIQVPMTQPFPTTRASRTGYTDTVPNNLLDVAQWDNGSVLDAVPDEQFTLQFIFLSSDREDGVALYGQKLYFSLDSALADIGDAWAELVRPAVTTNMILLGAVASNNDGTSQSVISSDVGFGAPFGGGGSAGGGGGDTSLFLLITGTREMVGDLDLGGNKLVNGDVDGNTVNIKPIALPTTGADGSIDPDELVINTADKKVYVGGDLVADHVELYSDAKVYRTGDLALQANNLYLAKQDVDPAEVFDPVKWQLIGSDSTGALTDAVVLNPATETRNTIDVRPANGAASVLRTLYDNTQSVDLFKFSDDATIDRFGIPTGAFGEDIFRVSQVQHTFTAVGTPIYFNGSIWSLADNGNTDRFPQGIVNQVIDGDNFLLQVGGRINDLNPTAFVGNVAPTPGTYYYASDTPGKLTNVEEVTPVPVLYAISPTQGIVKLTGTRQPNILTPENVIDLVYPVGSIYVTFDPANPSLRWAGTSWTAEASGRALVGVGGGWSVGETRGEETHRLTEAEIPVHDHQVPGQNLTTSEFRKQYGWTLRNPNAGGLAIYDALNINGTIGGANTQMEVSGNATGFAMSFDIDHQHSVTVSQSTTDQFGGTSPHNIVQPSIGVYMWRRTA